MLVYEIIPSQVKRCFENSQENQTNCESLLPGYSIRPSRWRRAPNGSCDRPAPPRLAGGRHAEVSPVQPGAIFRLMGACRDDIIATVDKVFDGDWQMVPGTSNVSGRLLGILRIGFILLGTSACRVK